MLHAKRPIFSEIDGERFKLDAEQVNGLAIYDVVERKGRQTQINSFRQGSGRFSRHVLRQVILEGQNEDSAKALSQVRLGT